MSDRCRARVIRVKRDKHGAVLASVAAVGDTVLLVKDAGDLAFDDEIAGTLLVDDDAATQLTYTDVEYVEDTDQGDLTTPDTVRLSAELTVAIPADTQLWVYEEPEDPDDDGVVSDYTAICVPEDDEDAAELGGRLHAVIPPNFQDDLPIGKQPDPGVPVVLEYDDDTDEWAILRFRGKPRGLKHEPNDPHPLTFDEVAAGAFTHQLIHSRIATDRALVCYANGVAYSPSDLDINATDGIVTVTMGGWEKTTNADIWFDYWYRRGPAKVRPSPLSVPIGADWRYAFGLANTPATYAAVGFDDSGWSLGPSGFGWGTDLTNVGTVSPDPLNVWTRFTGTTLGGAVTLTALVDNWAYFYIDGTLVWSPGYNPAYQSHTVSLAAGDHVFAVRGVGDGSIADKLIVSIQEAA